MERVYLQHIKSRIYEPRMFIQVIVGPRQVGKTTMVNQMLGQIEIPQMNPVDLFDNMVKNG